MSHLVQAKIGYSDDPTRPVHFSIVIHTDKSQSGKVVKNEESSSLLLEISSLKEQIKEAQGKINDCELIKDLLTKRNQSLQRQNEDLAAQILSYEKFKSKSQEAEQKQQEELKELRKKLKENEKIIETHFETIEDLKSKYQEDFKQKTAELEKKVLDTQKTLNIKTSQVLKLSHLLKEREQKRSSAEVILDELEKKNNEMIEKNVKNEKIIFDLEKKVNELNKRLSGSLAELKSNDEIIVQKDQQMKKLLNKIKAQEIEIQKIEEENKSKEKKLADLLKSSKNLRSSYELKPSKNSKEDDLKKFWEIVASKDEEINLMKDMIKSLQIKNPSPSSSSSKFVKNSKLPPLASSSSIRELKAEESKSNQNIRVKSDFKIREIDTKMTKKNVFSSPNLPKSVKAIKVVTRKAFEDSPSKVSKSKDFYDETPKFGGPGENFPDIRVSSLDKVLAQDRRGEQLKVFVINEDEGRSQESVQYEKNDRISRNLEAQSCQGSRPKPQNDDLQSEPDEFQDIGNLKNSKEDQKIIEKNEVFNENEEKDRKSKKTKNYKESEKPKNYEKIEKSKKKDGIIDDSSSEGKKNPGKYREIDSDSSYQEKSEENLEPSDKYPTSISKEVSLTTNQQTSNPVSKTELKTLEADSEKIQNFPEKSREESFPALKNHSSPSEAEKMKSQEANSADLTERNPLLSSSNAKREP